MSGLAAAAIFGASTPVAKLVPGSGRDPDRIQVDTARRRPAAYFAKAPFCTTGTGTDAGNPWHGLAGSRLT